MTMDDECSVYVGGVPYNCSEDSLRKVFNLYGTIVAVKIINDRATHGKCYAFVTFTNPQSAIAAMNDMDGKTINGRVVRVNEVKTRGGGRLNVNRDNFRHNVDHGRGRDRQRDFNNHERDRFGGRYNERSRERDRSLDRDVGRAEEYGHDYDREEDHLVGKDQDLEDNERDGSRNHRLDSDGEREMNRNDDYGGVEPARRRNSLSDDHHSKDFSSDSGYDSYDEINEQLEISIQKRDELKEEIAGMEQSLDERKQTVLDFQKKSKKLEDSLKSAKKHTSQRKMQLTKLHKLYVQVRDYTEKLKSSEQELQSLVDLAYKESDYGDDIGKRVIAVLNKAITVCSEAIEKHKGKLVVKEAARAVSERDDKLLAEHMAKLRQDNEEVSGDEDSEEEEDTGMG